MKSSTRDKAEGVFHKVKGTLKKAVGEVSGDRKLKAEGADEKTTGKVQEKVGKAKKVFGK